MAYGYDEVNRVTSRSVAITGGGTSSVGYSYYPAGISTMTYPSAKVLQYDYDDAGRTTSAAIGTTNYATGIQYASHGAMSQMTYGNGLVETWSYNAALQPFSIAVSGTSSLTLQYSYCSTISLADCGTNNGNGWMRAAGHRCGISCFRTISMGIERW